MRFTTSVLASTRCIVVFLVALSMLAVHASALGGGGLGKLPPVPDVQPRVVPPHPGC